MSKILISSIGTGRKYKNNESARGKYEKTLYKFEGSEKEFSTSFIAAALCEYLQVDKLYLIGTGKSMWEEVYNYFAVESNQKLDDSCWLELGEKAEASKPGDFRIKDEDLRKVELAIDNYLKFLRSSSTGGSRCYLIEYGLNEKELWDIFDVFMVIGDNIKENDEVFIDITHGFRSIPLFSYLIIDLIGILKVKNSFSLGGIFYGMLEAKSDLDYAPIVDLGPFYNVTLWSRGAYNFINFGNGYLLAKLVKDDKISKSIRKISDIVNINYVNDFKKEIDSLNNLLLNSQSDEPVVKYMQPYLISFTERFKGINSSGELQFALAKWHFENKNFAQGYICLAESIITKFLSLYREKDGTISWKKRNRDKVKTLVCRLKNHDKYKDISKIYEEISDIRNWIAHAGFLEKNGIKISCADAVEKAEHYIKKVQKSIFNDRSLYSITEEFPFETL